MAHAWNYSPAWITSPPGATIQRGGCTSQTLSAQFMNRGMQVSSREPNKGSSKIRAALSILPGGGSTLGLICTLLQGGLYLGRLTIPILFFFTHAANQPPLKARLCICSYGMLGTKKSRAMWLRPQSVGRVGVSVWASGVERLEVDTMANALRFLWEGWEDKRDHVRGCILANRFAGGSLLC